MDRLASGSMDRYLPEDVRTILEERFWHTVQERSTVEALARDRTILSSPGTHPTTGHPKRHQPIRDRLAP